MKIMAKSIGIPVVLEHPEGWARPEYFAQTKTGTRWHSSNEHWTKPQMGLRDFYRL